MFRLAMAHHFNFNKIKLVHPVAHFSATSSHHDVLFTQKRLCVVFKTIYKKRFFIIHEDV